MDGRPENTRTSYPPSTGGPSHPARPGLFFIIDVQRREIFVPQEMIEEEGPELRNGQIGKVIRWRKS